MVNPRCSSCSLIGPELDVDRDVDGEAGAALEVEPAAAGPAGEEVEGDPQAAVGEDRGEEAVGAGEVDDDRAVLDRDLDQHVAGGLPGSDVPVQVAADRGAQLARLEAGAAGDAEQRHRLAVHSGHGDPDAGAARDLGRGGRRVDAQLARGQQVDGGAGVQVAGQADVQRESRTERDLDVQLLREVDPGGGTDPGHGGMASSVGPRSTMKIRSTGGPPPGPGCTKATLATLLANRASRSSSSSHSQVGGTPAVVAPRGGERVVEQVAQQVEAELALDVRRRGRGRGGGVALQQAEQLGDAGDDRVPALEVVRHQVADQPLRERGGEGLDLRTRRPGGRAVHGVGDAVDGWSSRKR